jgi:hypothetical protein
MAGDTRIVVDCPVCNRTIWANTRCYHGQVPLGPIRVDKNPSDAELVEPDGPREKRVKRRDKGH